LLAQRVATAAVGIPVLLAVILAGGWPYATVAALILAAAGAEFAHLRYSWLDRRTALTAASAGAVAIVAQWGGLAALIAAGTCVVLALAASAPPAARGGWPALGVAYVGGLGATLVLLRELDNGREWALLAVFCTFAVDTAAYFTGRAFGRHRMSPRISPSKTWEGFAGGWLGGFAAVLALNYLLGIRVEPATAVALAALFPVAAALGDLAESALKRASDVKDASGLIPGHGGFLDRLDSVLFTVALTYVFARFA
jgi:phosphatidate cytidylyltransferase